MNSAFEGLRGFVTSASHRIVQFTESKFGQNDATDLDTEVRNLMARAEQVRCWTEKIVASTSVFFLRPNPLGTTTNDYISSADKKHQDWFGSSLIAVGQELKPEADTYGLALIDLGYTQLKICKLEREFALKANQNFMGPLIRFLEAEGEALARETMILESRKSDFDDARKKFRRAKSNVQALDKAAEILARSQDEFNRQIMVVKTICYEILESHEQDIQYLADFIKAQTEFHDKSSKSLKNLLKRNKIIPRKCSDKSFQKQLKTNGSGISATSSYLVSPLTGSPPHDKILYSMEFLKSIGRKMDILTPDYRFKLNDADIITLK